MKQLLASLVLMALVATAVGGTLATFSDTETSTGNTITAGTLDLLVNGASVNSVALSVPNAYPGAFGTATWTLKNDGTISGTLAMLATYTSDENSLVNPELKLDPPDTGDDDDGSDLDGELDEEMVFTLKRDGVAVVAGVGVAAVKTALTAESQALAGGASVEYKLEWSVPPATGNNIQSDDLGLSITFTLDQAGIGE